MPELTSPPAHDSRPAPAAQAAPAVPAAQAVPAVDRMLADYAASHTRRATRITHFIGIPLIVFGLLAMLAPVVLVAGAGGTPLVTLAELLIAAGVIFYLFLDVRLALAMLVVVVALDIPARLIADWRVGLAAFVVGWIAQGIGHAVYERGAPAFLHNLVHLLTGPLFLLNEVLHIRPVAAVRPPDRNP